MYKKSILKVGDVVFFNNDGSFVSWGISLFTKSQFTHVGIVYEIKDDIITLAEALASGFTKKDYSVDSFFKRVNKSKFVIKRASNMSTKAVKDTIDMLEGRPYGFLDLLRIAVYKLTGKRIGGDSTRFLICSEAVALVLRNANNKIDLSKERNKPISYISPADIFHSKHLKFV